MERLIDIAALHAKLDECRRATSDAELRRLFGTFEMDYKSGLPSDPFSAEYYQFQMDLYSEISGKSYRLENEATPFDSEVAVLRPFPFLTRNPAVAGVHFGAMSCLLRVMATKPEQKVLEFGPGWGNTTITLAKLGMKVTAVDIGANFCTLLERRAAHENVSLTVVNDDFMWVEKTDEQFDSIIFFECFHHCADHMRLLRALPKALKPEGRIYFGAEPIVEDFPVPWGVRMDGESLWAVGHHGWLELGFRDDYFRKALARAGLSARKHQSLDMPWISVWEAWKTHESGIVFNADDENIVTHSGVKLTNGIVFSNASSGYEIWGPYVSLSKGKYRAIMHFTPGVALSGKVKLDVCTGIGESILKVQNFNLAKDAAEGKIGIDFELDADSDNVEIRLFVKDRLSGQFDRLEIVEQRK